MATDQLASDIRDGGTSSAFATPERRATAGYAWYVLAVLFLVNCFNAMDRSIISILIEPIKRDLFLNDTQIGFVTGLGYALVYSIVGLLIAGIVNSGNRRNLLAGGIAFWSMMTAVTGQTIGFASMLGARLGIAAGEATCYPTSLSLISDYFRPSKRPRAIALFQLGTYGGIIFGISSASVISAHYGWRAAFHLLGLPGLGLALILWLTVREPRRGMNEDGVVSAEVAGPSGPGAMIALLRGNPAFAILVASSVVVAIAQVTMGSWVPPFLMRVHGITQQQVGLIAVPAIALSGVFGTLIGGFLGTRIAQRDPDPRAPLKVMLYSAPLAVPALLTFLFAPTLPLSIVGGAFGAFFIAMHFGPLVAVIIATVDIRSRGVATSLLVSAQFLIGLGLGPFIVGALSDLFQPTMGHLSLRYAMTIAPATVAIGWILSIIGYRALGARSIR